jgi:hypothetical protein
VETAERSDQSRSEKRLRKSSRPTSLPSTEGANPIRSGTTSSLLGSWLRPVQCTSKKGRQGYVKGRLRTREFEAQENGGKLERTKIVAAAIVKDDALGQTILEIEVRGKRGVGYCKSMLGAVRAFERLKARLRPARVDEAGRGGAANHTPQRDGEGPKTYPKRRGQIDGLHNLRPGRSKQPRIAKLVLICLPDGARPMLHGAG